MYCLISRCNIEIGNINHSPSFIKKYASLVDDILIEDTNVWLNQQKDKSVSITLDIGTCYGITLLAVLYISGSEVRLANILPTNTKKGDKLAELCLEAMNINKNVSIFFKYHF